eukprot:2938352-Rhodomonas_salina.2
MTGQEVVYLLAMLLGIGFEQHKTRRTVVWEDKTACIQTVHNPVNLKCTRHINIRSYFVCNLVRDDALVLFECAGTHNVANALSKILPGPWFTMHHPFLIGTCKQYKAFFV